MLCWKVVEVQSTIDSSPLSTFISNDTLYFFSVCYKGCFKSLRKLINFWVFKYLFHSERLYIVTLYGSKILNDR